MAEPAAQSGQPLVCVSDEPMAGCHCAGATCYYPLFYCDDDSPYPEYLTAAAVASGEEGAFGVEGMDTEFTCPEWSDEDHFFDVDGVDCVYYPAGEDGTLDTQDVFPGVGREIADCESCGVFDLGPCECEHEEEACNIVGVTFAIAGTTIGPECCPDALRYEHMECTSPGVANQTINLRKHSGHGFFLFPPQPPLTCFFLGRKTVAGFVTLHRSYGTPEDPGVQVEDCTGNESFAAPDTKFTIALRIDVPGPLISLPSPLLSSWSDHSDIWSEDFDTSAFVDIGQPTLPTPCDEPGVYAGDADPLVCLGDLGEPFLFGVEFDITGGTYTTTLVLDCPGPP